MTQPRSFMLSYLPAATTATRLRKTACIGLIIATAIYFIAGILLGWAALSAGYELAISWAGTPTPTPADIWEYAPHPLIYIALGALLAGGLLTLCAASVYKAHRWPIYIAQPLLIPIFLLFCLIAVLGLIIPAYDPPRSPILAWSIGIPTFLLTVVLALLTLDMLSYLRWLLRRPRDEMPKRPFIPAVLKGPPTSP